MSRKVRAILGEESNDAYCQRLAELVFPRTVRIDGRAYDEAQLWAKLAGDRELQKQLARRFFLGRKWATEHVVRAAFPLKATFLGKTYHRTAQEELPAVLQEKVACRESLLEDLKNNHKLQQLAAVRTHYTPSKWLLEQEMTARGIWDSGKAEDVYTTVARKGLTGVCFSGGGIRSATFNLGVTQGLAQLGLLPHVDYLSSVSGGGYIHEFLAAWILRHPRGRDGVIEELVPQAEPGCLPRSPEPIKWLRRYASYLTPARGVFSTDTWTLLAIWLRNTILNQIPIVATLGFAFLLVHLLVPSQAAATAQYPPLKGVLPYLLVATQAAALVLAVWSLTQLGTNLRRQSAMRSAEAGAKKWFKKDLLTNNEVQWRLIAPWLGFSVWMTYWVQMGNFDTPWWYWAGAAAFAVWVLAMTMLVIFAGGAMKAWDALHPYPHVDLVARFRKRIAQQRALKRASRELKKRKKQFIAKREALAALEGKAGKEDEFESLRKTVTHEEVGIDEATRRFDSARIALERTKAAETNAWPEEMAEWRVWARHWGWAALCFAAGGVLASLIACALGYGLVLVMKPLAEGLSGWVGSVSASPQPVQEALKFSVSGTANHFTATLAGSLNAAKAAASGMLMDPWRIQLAFLPGLLLGVPYIAIELALGLLGRDFGDMRREWLARLRAWSLLYALLWAGVVSASLLGPYLGYWLLSRPVAKWSSAVAFLLAHGAMIFAGSSGKADGKPTDKGFLGFQPADLAALLALPVSMTGILLVVSFAASWMVDGVSQYVHQLGYLLALPVHSVIGVAEVIRAVASTPTWGQFWLADVLCILLAGGVGWLFGWRVDVNEFSMQLFYRNRLSRCYLAATVPNRQADPFTGFDGRGEMPDMVNPRARRLPPGVTDLLPDKFNRVEKMKGNYDGPFPIFCTTLNLTTGEDLATQERKGASFAFTPLYSGYSVPWTDGDAKNLVSYNGYVPTKDYAYPMGGIHLDTAVAISGAAANPNMGYNSNPALAFLMTFFNVRLGWWITNTRRMDKWKAANGRVTPQFALGYLLKELFGMVNDSAPFVNLSDGGHFENMGLYELVRRRCRYIVVCDAEEDAEVNFGGMGGAITKCRADFGAEIDLDLRPLRLDDKTGYSKAHCVVGTIRYPPPPEDRVDDEAATDCECLMDEVDDKYTGVIVYMKSSLVGDEPPDLLTYKLAHNVFPQDSTANQWFTETQFEAYRRLGHHVTMTAVQPALSPQKTKFDARDTIEELFQRMYAIWYPRTPEMEKHLGEHLGQYERILSELRGRTELAGLEVLMFDPKPGDTARKWIAANLPAGSLAYGLQFANSVLDFMATVYLNLELAFPDNRTSPHAEWWICIFRRWCRVDLVRRSWVEHAASYPLEFRLFARRELGLPQVMGIRE